MKNTHIIFSLTKRLIGVIFLVLNYLCYGLMVSLAADTDLSATERVVYPVLVYGISWVFVIVGIYLAGPELIAKFKEYFILVKSKLLKNDK
jgi:hypothetical protein|tara:strand:- start:353 stop:625 length:273 start_codon:yes stop_codon:yes gene_type:complete